LRGEQETTEGYPHIGCW